MTINGGALYTNDPDVTLSVIAPSWADCASGRERRRLPRRQDASRSRSTIRWHLAESGPERLPKTVYLRFGNDGSELHRRHHPRPDQADRRSATVARRCRRDQRRRRTAAAAHERRPTACDIRAKDATSGVAKVQFARNKRHPSALRKFARISRYKGDQRAEVRAGEGPGRQLQPLASIR